jgi:hypothetical protein
MKASYKRKNKITNNICLAVGLHEVLDDLPPGATLGKLTLVTNIQGFELKSIAPEFNRPWNAESWVLDINVPCMRENQPCT